ncbi:MAG: hypothetical protein CMN76_06065 [Spirochaetaceae bacterium]|nr:hypothetical protein [Spirochaetaceae bacterium]
MDFDIRARQERFEPHADRDDCRLSCVIGRGNQFPSAENHCCGRKKALRFSSSLKPQLGESTPACCTLPRPAAAHPITPSRQDTR